MSLTVGTAGHVDHGKTWLVRALTGKDTDRLPEEQARGISIDLGYAPLELADGRRLSLIDVPGHERFVRNMVAGATGIDLFLLVVDAAEGARAQTHEHLAILSLLGIEHGVVAVTKADAVDAETLEFALEEARERTRVLGILAGTLAARGPGVELTISDVEGQVGADVLLDALQELRDAGAEAIELSTVTGPAVRVVASTSLVDVEGGVEVDGTRLVSPYRFRVIGESRTLAAALDIPGGVLDVLRQRKAQAVVTQRPSVLISSLRAAPSPRYARPAVEGDGE